MVLTLLPNIIDVVVLTSYTQLKCTKHHRLKPKKQQKPQNDKNNTKMMFFLNFEAHYRRNKDRYQKNRSAMFQIYQLSYFREKIFFEPTLLTCPANALKPTRKIVVLLPDAQSHARFSAASACTKFFFSKMDSPGPGDIV